MTTTESPKPKPKPTKRKSNDFITKYWWTWPKLNALKQANQDIPTEKLVRITMDKDNTLSLAPQQQQATSKVLQWHRDYRGRRTTQQVFKLFGYAGTGKTTLARYIASQIDSAVLFAAYTGKAAMVLTTKGCPASTLHSCLYAPIIDDDTGRVTGFAPSTITQLHIAGLIIVDEVSMVNDEMACLLLSTNTPILVLGDPFQLPPISGLGYFDRGRPDVVLTEVHRNAKDSPVLYLATKIRNNEPLESGNYGDSSIRIAKSEDLSKFNQLICGKNLTRRYINQRMRNDYGYVNPLVKGEKLVCLANNEFAVNGSSWSLTKLKAINTITSQLGKRLVKDRVVEVDGYSLDFGSKENAISMWLALDLIIDPSVEYPWYLRSTRRESTHTNYKTKVVTTLDAVTHPVLHVDYGYCLTCHKSQGSQWDHVAVFDESQIFRHNAARWLYTAVTRAAQSVTIFRK